jgi:hypothetical protein
MARECTPSRGAIYGVDPAIKSFPLAVATIMNQEAGDVGVWASVRPDS